MPDVVGKPLADAATALAAEGLKAGVKYVPSDEPQGQVVAQAKPAGTEGKRGDTVQINVSVGAEPAADASVPNVAGRRLDEARQALEQAGFEVLALDLERRRAPQLERDRLPDARRRREHSGRIARDPLRARLVEWRSMALPEQTGRARRRPTLGRWLLALLAVVLGLAVRRRRLRVRRRRGGRRDDRAAATTGPGSAATVPDVEGCRARRRGRAARRRGPARGGQVRSLERAARPT